MLIIVVKEYKEKFKIIKILGKNCQEVMKYLVVLIKITCHIGQIENYKKVHFIS